MSSELTPSPAHPHTHDPSRLEFRAGQFVQRLQESIYTQYIITKVLGTARYGKVFLAVHRATRQKRAIKEVEKALVSQEEVGEAKFIHEVEVMSRLDHPNILKVYEMFEDPLKYYIVTEACEGGELFDYIISNRHLTEQTAAHIIFQVLSALCHCHEQGIAHRNLAPENLLIERAGQAGEISIKVIDFAMAELVEKSRTITGKVTYDKPHHTAPEVFSLSCTEKSDIWSCGVLLYLLLSGSPPFDGHDDATIQQAICRGQFDFPESSWANISEEAKALIRRMLNMDVERRPSAQECLRDEWIGRYKDRTLPDEVLNHASWDNLTRFQTSSHLRKAFMSFIASQLLSKDQTAQLKLEFQSLDVDGDGRLSREELVRGYSHRMPEEEAVALIDKVMASVDTDGSGFVEYSEFVAAAASHDSLLSKTNLELAFEACDKDNSGALSIEELKAMLGGEHAANPEVWSKLIAEADTNGDGEIDMKEFVSLMLQTTNL